MEIDNFGLIYGRTGFFKCFEYLDITPTIVEIGMQRRYDGDCSDGCSTSIFSWYLKEHGGKLYSIDIDNNNIELNKRELENRNLFNENIHLICQDGINFFDNFNEKIDLLYLDSWDWSGSDEEKNISEINHLVCFSKAERLLSSNSIIMIDDVKNSSFEGKGKLLIPYLLKNGYVIESKGEWIGNDGNVVFNDYQIILKKNYFNVIFTDKLYITSHKDFKNCILYVRHPISKFIYHHQILNFEQNNQWWFQFPFDTNNFLVEIYDEMNNLLYKKIINIYEFFNKWKIG